MTDQAPRRPRNRRRLATAPQQGKPAGHHHGHDEEQGVAHEKHHEDMLGVLPDDVADGLRKLRKHDAAVAKALSDPKRAAEFYRDPVSTLRGLGIEVPPAVARYAGQVRQPEPPRMTFRIPTGQLVRPRVDVRFTNGKGR